MAVASGGPKIRARHVCYGVVLAWVAMLAISAPAALAASSGFALPDNRQWELVSPADKRGAGIEPISRGGGPIESSENGGAITYVATASPFPATAQGYRGPEFTQILSKRAEGGGWTSQDITPPNNSLAELPGGHNSEYDLFSPDLTAALVEPLGEAPLPPLPEGSEKTLYLWDNSSESFLPLVTTDNVIPGARFGEVSDNNVLRFLGASSDLEHNVFGSSEALTKNAVHAKGNLIDSLYEWSAERPAAEQLQLVSLLPPNGKGEELPTTAEGEEGEEAKLGFEDLLVRNAVSSDGSRVVWEAGSGVESKHLYVREMSEGRTVQVDVLQPEAEGYNGSPVNGPVFQGASSDGSRIFFTDEKRLTKGSQAGEERPDLYVFEPSGAGGRLTDLTETGSPGESAAVQGDILGYNEEGTDVYFVANGALRESGAVPGQCERARREAGAFCDLYADHYNGGEWEHPRLVARLSSEDNSDWAATSTTNLGFLTASVSPNGNYLAFMSNQPLTGYDNHDVNSNALDEEVYLYDSRDGRLVCGSCDPTGAQPEGVLDPEGVDAGSLLVDHAEANEGSWLAGSIPGWTEEVLTEALYQSRYVTNDGRLFFNSPEPLVPAATNGKEDVFEYEPEGVGPPGAQCGPAAESESEVVDTQGEAGNETTGCIALISSGTSNQESAFLEASGTGPGGEEGEDVFFLTTSQLVPQDTDDAFDVYDAHTCSAAAPCPASVTGATRPCDEIASCRPSGGVAPSGTEEPASETFVGVGNLPPSSPGSVKKPLTRAQKLHKALVACEKRPRKKRAVCERQARRKFGAAHKAKKATRASR